ncbi:MAG: ComF family protein [Oscillospiraceae bacterium]|jgi:ComF family protein|nr:ComF family protein [Oscillospiraceae bacterium]
MKRVLSRAVEALRGLLFPRSCVFCGKPEPGGVCGECKLSLPWYGEPTTLTVDGAALPVTAPLRYEGLARGALLRFKFHGRVRAARPFASLMAACVRNLLPEFDAIACVPLSLTRRLRRGYNQTRLLADALSRELDGAPVISPLRKRVRVANSSLGAEQREQNTQGAFRLKRSASLAGLRVLLVDDVLTTGATIRECVRVLRGGGADVVGAVTLCAVARNQKAED